MEHVDLLTGVILPYANFFIFLAMLIYFARKPAAAAALKKRDEFLRVMTESKKTYDEANQKLVDLKARHAKLADEITEIKESTRAAAELEAKRIISEAERLADLLKEEAKRIAAAEVQKARAELRKEIVETVSANVKEKISKEVTGDMQHNIVRKNIAELRTIRVGG